MPKWILILAPFVGLFAYLWVSYAGFYHYIGKKALKSPYKENYYFINNSSSNSVIRYVSLGDSLTAGVGSEVISSTYPYLYAIKLKEDGNTVEFLNVAYPGANTEDLIKSQLDQAINFNPQYITVLIGVNDIHAKWSIEKYKTNMTFIVDELKTKTSAKIILINLPYIGSNKIVFPPFNWLMDFRTRQFNAIIQSLGREKNLTVVDLYGATHYKDKSVKNYYSSDLYHPSGSGYIIWSKFINAN